MLTRPRVGSRALVSPLISLGVLGALGVAAAPVDLTAPRVAGAQFHRASAVAAHVDVESARDLVAIGVQERLADFIVVASATDVREAPDPATAAASAAAASSAATGTVTEVWSGRASWYGSAFAGRRTASGDTFNPDELTAAHRTLPFGTRVRVTSAATGRSVVVTITDRGPYVGTREIDLSRAAAEAIGIRTAGVGRVTLERLA